MSKLIKNVNVLDITSAEEEALQGLTALKNVNVLIYSKRTAKWLGNVTMKNVNVSIEVPENCKLVQMNGMYEIDNSFGTNSADPVYIVINGKMIIKPHTTPDTIERAIAGIVVNGHIICPDHLEGIVRSKIAQHNGHISSYMGEADFLYDHARVDDTFLKSLPAASKLAFIGNTRLTDTLDASLLNEKVAKIQCVEHAIVREDIIELLGDKLVTSPTSKIVKLPEGATYVEHDLTLDSAAMGRFDHANLYVTGNIRLESDVTAEQVNRSFSKLHTDRSVICRKDIREAVFAKFDNPFVKVLDYTGKLLIIDNPHKLSPSVLKYTNETLSLIVNGVLEIAENVDPQLLFDKIDQIDNHGVINGNEEQLGVIHAKLRTNHGVVSEYDEDDEDNQDPDENVVASDEADVVIKNVNYLKL